MREQGQEQDDGEDVDGQEQEDGSAAEPVPLRPLPLPIHLVRGTRLFREGRRL